MLGALSDLVSVELSVGDAEAAVRTGEDLLRALEGSRDEWAWTFARLNTAAAWLAVDRPDRARPLLRAGWNLAVPLSLHPYYADYLALLAALEGRPRAAARPLGYADDRNDAAGPREPNEIAAVRRVEAAIATALGPGVAGQLRRDGMRLTDADVTALAFATEDVG